MYSSNGPDPPPAGFSSYRFPIFARVVTPLVAVVVGVAGGPAPGNTPSPKLPSTPSNSELLPVRNTFPVTEPVRSPLLSVFQTVYSFAPWLAQATSYPVPVFSAPTGAQPAPN